MSKRVYKLDINDIAEMIGPYLRTKFPELADLPDDTDVKLIISKRTKEITVEVTT